MPKLSREDAKDALRMAGLRATAPRVAVLRLLATAKKPLSHGEVVDAIGSDNWDQATLYRNLIKLVEMDLARVASHAGGVARYEAQNENEGSHFHPHFSCRKCGLINCLPEARFSGTMSRRWKKSLQSSDLELVGDCPDCLAKSA